MVNKSRIKELVGDCHTNFNEANLEFWMIMCVLQSACGYFKRPNTVDTQFLFFPFSVFRTDIDLKFPATIQKQSFVIITDLALSERFGKVHGVDLNILEVPSWYLLKFVMSEHFEVLLHFFWWGSRLYRIV